jgi:hypothetical protein
MRVKIKRKEKNERGRGEKKRNRRGMAFEAPYLGPSIHQAMERGFSRHRLQKH